MKNTRPALFSLFILLALISSSIFSSFKPLNACEYANTNMDFVKIQTQTALEANDLNIVKLFTKNALNVIDQTKTDFIDCGCIEATQPINSIEENLKLVRTSNHLEESKIFLRAALQSVSLSIQLLMEYEEDNSSFYGNNVLVMNTTSSIDEQGGIVLPSGKAREEMINESLSKFRASVENIVKNVECEKAFFYITKLHKNAKKDLNNVSLSDNEKNYHEKVRDITYQALLELNGCPVD